VEDRFVLVQDRQGGGSDRYRKRASNIFIEGKGACKARTFNRVGNGSNQRWEGEGVMGHGVEEEALPLDSRKR